MQRSCLGQVVSSKQVDFREKVRPQAAKLPRTSGFFKKVSFCQTFCPRQRSCLGQVASYKHNRFSGKKFCPRQRSCLGQVASYIKNRFLESSAPGSEAARDKWCVQKKSPNFEKKFCPRQRSCLGQVVCSKKVRFSRKSSAPGSEAARDK